MKLDKDRIEAEEAMIEVGSFLVQCDNPADEEFCRLVASGSGLKPAARQSGAISEARASNHARKPHIVARINYLRHTACLKVDVTLDGLLAELMILKELAWSKGHYGKVQSLIADIARLGGLDEERSKVPRMGWKEVAETIAEAKGITLEQMRAIARADAAKNAPDLPPPHKVH